MNRIPKIALLTLLICLCLLGAGTLGTFLYVQYRDVPTRMKDLEKRVETLESKKGWRTAKWQEVIATSDCSGTNRVFILTNQVGTAQWFPTYPQYCPSGLWVEAVWVTDWSPRSEILKFEEFKVECHKDQIRIIAKPKPNESISMQFSITAIFQQ